jgi:hypothetical protein
MSDTAASPFSITLSPLGRGQGEGDPLPRGERE